MTKLEDLVQDFLAQRRIAVAGVSRTPGQAANAIYRKLRDAGYEVYAINPNAEEVEGVRCYANLESLPDPVDAIVVATPPEATAGVVRRCADLGIRRVWMHRSFGKGSVDDDAVAFCAECGIAVIAGACPMMYCEPIDFGHRCMRWILRVTGGLPKAASSNASEVD